MPRVPVPSVLLLLLAAALLQPSGASVPYLADALVAGDCGTGEDAPDDFATAAAMPRSFDCVGSVSRQLGDAGDWFRFDVVAGEQISFAIRADPGSPASVVQIFDPDGGRPLHYTGGAAVDVADPPGAWPPYTITAGKSGAWRLAVGSDADHGSGYRLFVDVHAPRVQDDCGSGRDAGHWDYFGRSGAPVAFALPAACAGWFPLDSPDRSDAYEFHVAQEGTLEIELTSVSRWQFYLCVEPVEWGACPILDPSGRTLTLRGPAAPGVRSIALGAWAVTSQLEGEYGLRVTATDEPYPLDDCGAGADAGDTFADATPLALPVFRCAGDTHAFEDPDADWYAVEASTGDTITAFVEGDRFPPGVCIASPSEVFDERVCRLASLAASTACLPQWFAAGESCRSDVRVADEAGTWRILVAGGSTGPYTLSAFAVPGV